jgi:hypothetical protein
MQYHGRQYGGQLCSYLGPPLTHKYHKSLPKNQCRYFKDYQHTKLWAVLLHSTTNILYQKFTKILVIISDRKRDAEVGKAPYNVLFL